MNIQGNTLNYEWIDNWAELNSEEGSSHNGIAIDSEGKIYLSFSKAPFLRVFTAEGEMVDSFELSGDSMHSLFISKDSEGEWLWNIDVKNNIVSKSTLEGEIIDSINRENFKLGENEKFNITAGTVDPNNGNLWVTDGYGWARAGEWGGNKIYCFSPSLELLFSFDGSEANCGIFHEPHWIFADTRKEHTEVFIADRRNNRLVVYSADGKFLRTVTGDFNTPSGFSSFDDKLVVAELEGRVHILDKNDNIIETFCDGSEYTQVKGWPNRKIDDKWVSPLEHVEVGKFNSPHGIVADKSGNIYVHEWHIGVRVTKLVKAA